MKIIADLVRHLRPRRVESPDEGSISMPPPEDCFPAHTGFGSGLRVGSTGEHHDERE